MDVLGWLTGLLALATFWLAWTTREMAAATKQMAALESQPHLAVKDVVLKPGIATGPERQNPFVNIELKLTNPGKVLVRYRMASFDVEIHAKTVPPNSVMLNRGGVIHPGVETTFLFPSIQLPYDVPSPIEGKLELDIRYWAIVGEEQFMKATIVLRIHLAPNFDYRWFYSSGPMYS